MYYILTPAHHSYAYGHDGVGTLFPGDMEALKEEEKKKERERERERERAVPSDCSLYAWKCALDASKFPNGYTYNIPSDLFVLVCTRAAGRGRTTTFPGAPSRGGGGTCAMS